MTKQRNLPSDVRDPFVPPYPPSWFDRLTDWVDRLPGPAWAYYLSLAAGAALVGLAIQWKEGGLLFGTFGILRVWNFSNFALLLGLMHYLDRIAGSALVTFRPLLAGEKASRRSGFNDETKFAEHAYRLTTLPARPTLVTTAVGAIFPVVVAIPQLALLDTLTPFRGAAQTPISTASVMASLILGNMVSFLFFYHSVHQLSHISRIYSKHARINLYQLQPLYALSRPGVITALGSIALTYTWAALSGGRGISSVEFGLTIVAAVLAGAAFALPLWGAHRRLVAEKDARMGEASARFEAATIELHSQLERGRLTQMDQLNKALSSLEIEQNALRKIPTWPWQPGAIRAVVAALLLPLAIWVLQQLLARFLAV